MAIVRVSLGLPPDQTGGKAFDLAEMPDASHRQIISLGSADQATGAIAEVVVAPPAPGTAGIVAYVVPPGSPAQEGTDGPSAPLVPTGGTGIRGWLASIYQKLAGGIGVTGTFWPATQPVSGSVAVSNLPGTQPVSGTVGVSNFPATQPVSGTISVSNLPATQPISGTVAVSALPALPGGSNAIGTVGVTALPALPTGANAIGTVGVTALPALPTGANTIGGVTTVGSGTVIDDTATVTTTPAALPAHVCNEVQVQNDPFSAADVYLGSATGQHTHIQPGMAQTLPATNSNLFWVKTLAGTATVNILARS